MIPPTKEDTVLDELSLLGDDLAGVRHGGLCVYVSRWSWIDVDIDLRDGHSAQNRLAPARQSGCTARRERRKIERGTDPIGLTATR